MSETKDNIIRAEKDTSDDINLSPDQINVRDAAIGNILVSAAAGSGKTTVLVKRIIKKILDNEFSINEILVVTFTVEAADNMRRKIEKAVREKIKSTTDKEIRKRLSQQLDLLPGSYIQTMDSFCSRVIREKGYICADKKEGELLSPGMVILDTNELDVLMLRAANEAISMTYLEDPGEDFYDVTDMFGNGRTDKNLAEGMVAIFKKLRSIPDYIDYLDSMISEREECDRAGIIMSLDDLNAKIGDLLRRIDDDLINELISMTGEISFVSNSKKNANRQEAFITLLERVREYVNGCREAFGNGSSSLQVFKKIKDCTVLSNDILDNKEKLYNGLPKAGDGDNAQRYCDLFAPVAALILMLRKLIGITAPSRYKDSASVLEMDEKYVKLLSKNEDMFLEEQRIRTGRVKAYVDLLKKTDEIYRELKVRIRGTDFPDQEHMADIILKEAEARDYYRDKFKEIYIDEYQDNSPLQDHILEAIGKEGSSNIFRVGDVKQSIYKFRYADPDMFMEKMERFTKDPSEGKLFLLNENYRSRKEILDFVNLIFEQIMSREGSEIEYDDSQKLYHPTGEMCGHLPHVLIVDSTADISDRGKDEDERLEDVSSIEQGVLAEVKRYLDEGMKPEDICILTRRRNTAAGISSFLQSRGTPAQYVDELSIFEDIDIHRIINIIHIIGNSLRDEFLLGVLLSPYNISNLTLDEIAYIHKENLDVREDLPLITRLRRFVSRYQDEGKDLPDTGDLSLPERVMRFLDWYDDIRSSTVITDIGVLTERIYSDTGAAGSDPVIREKLTAFRDWLCDNYLRYGSDIASISASLENMKVKLGGKTSVTSAVRDPDKITCMTYHGSKGLEFKCVIVTELGCGKRPDRSGGIVFSTSKGLVANDYDKEKVMISPSLERVFYDEEELLSENAEGMRRLYVALTRAMDRLSVVLPLKFNEGDNAITKVYKGTRQEYDIKLGRQYWLYCRGGVSSAFLAAVLRSGDGSALERKLRGICCEGMERSGWHSDDTGLFDLSIVPYVRESRGSEETYDENDSLVILTDDYADFGLNTRPEEQTTGQGELYCEGIDERGFPVFPRYPYEYESKIPFKVTVSTLKYTGLTDATPMMLEVFGFEKFMERQRGEIGDSPSETGTFVHKLFRFTDMNRASISPEDAQDALRELYEEKILKEDELERAYEYADALYGFASSDTGLELREAAANDKAEYEKPIVFAAKAGDSEDALIQGIIDCIYYDKNGEAVIIDYKTDRFPDHMTEGQREGETVKRHRMQLDLYAAAVRAAGIEVSRKMVYLVRYGQFVDL